MESLYQQFSGDVRAPVILDENIILAEATINREQMAALACVAEHFDIPYRLKYIKEPK